MTLKCRLVIPRHGLHQVLGQLTTLACEETAQAFLRIGMTQFRSTSEPFHSQLSVSAVVGRRILQCQKELRVSITLLGEIIVPWRCIGEAGEDGILEVETQDVALTFSNFHAMLYEKVMEQDIAFFHGHQTLRMNACTSLQHQTTIASLGTKNKRGNAIMQAFVVTQRGKRRGTTVLLKRCNVDHSSRHPAPIPAIRQQPSVNNGAQ
mmetsp:Transcript_1889/g.5299  ORF Transcript_1889/g.5299 Transcript_1889/m.5299 type:complete len:207 (+) Transcript_1889:1073-1693(+)